MISTGEHEGSWTDGIDGSDRELVEREEVLK